MDREDKVGLVEILGETIEVVRFNEGDDLTIQHFPLKSIDVDSIKPELIRGGYLINFSFKTVGGEEGAWRVGEDKYGRVHWNGKFSVGLFELRGELFKIIAQPGTSIERPFDIWTDSSEHREKACALYKKVVDTLRAA